jgi:inhibitor of KinA sporulation pathway (predicted exonuclease)
MAAAAPPATSPFFSVDVECAATTRRHCDRTPVSVALVDAQGQALLRRFVKPAAAIVSYLTPLTGVTARDVENAPSLETVVGEVKAILRACAPLPVLVGSGIQHDLTWLSLEKGKDYSEAIDLAEMFKAWNPKYKQFNKFSLAMLGSALLSAPVSTDIHSPLEDAQLSIRLYSRYKDDPAALEQAKQSMIGRPGLPTFVKKNNYKFEGVCMAAYYPEKCSCGAPSEKNM